MSNSRISNEPRQLSQDEMIQLQKAQEKWYPKLFQTYNTSLYDMMASPIKKAIIHALVVGIILLVIFVANKKYKFIPFKDSLVLIGMLCVLLFLCVPVAISQYKTNDNIKLFLTLTKPGATKYDYQSSPIIRDKLMRNSFGRGRSGSGLGSGILGGALGYGIGSSRGGRRR